MEDGSFEDRSMEDDALLYQAAEDFSQHLRAGSGGSKRPMEDFIEDKLEDLPTLKRARPSANMWGLCRANVSKGRISTERCCTHSYVVFTQQT